MYKVLCFEDDKISAFIMEKLLQKDFEVQIFDNCDNFYSAITTQAFDVLILDIDAVESETEGKDIMRAIRKIPQQANAKIIATKSYATSEDQRNFLEAGFEEYISKPIARNILVEKIYRLLEKQTV